VGNAINLSFTLPFSMVSMISMIVTSLEKDQGELWVQAEVLQKQGHLLSLAFPKRQLINLGSHTFLRLSISIDFKVIDFCV
jgi:hypothetical protein